MAQMYVCAEVGRYAAMMVSALAVLCARNERVHIRRCIGDLIEAGLDVHVIDHGSTDGTREIAAEFKGHGVVGIEDLAWDGSFSLSEQLRAKRQAYERSRHDWVVHVDADEWLCVPASAGIGRLIDAISRAHAEGFDCINFRELAFVAKGDANYAHEDYASRMRDYYLFEPTYPRLIRAMRRDSGIDTLASGGHVPSAGDVRRWPHDLILRHYIALSAEHVRAKYLSRTFSAEDIARGWHRRRLAIDPAKLVVRESAFLRTLPAPCAHDSYDLSCPAPAHFWEW